MSETLRLMPIRTFLIPKRSTPLPFDLYISLGPSKFTKVFNANEVMDIERYESYLKKGLQYFYIPEEQRETFLTVGIDVLKEIRKVSGGFENDDARQILDEVTEQCLLDIYHRMSLTKETERALQYVTRTYVDVINEQKHLLPAFVALAKKKDEAAKHAITTSLFSALLARAHSPNDPNLAYICAYAGLLHDIGFALLKTDLSEHDINLSPAELEQLSRHPNLGAQVVGQIADFPPEVRIAILQHHEGYDGTGYPMGLKKDGISLPARIVAVAESFVTLIMGNAKQFPLPPSLAAQSMSKNSRLDPQLFALFTQLLKL